MNGYYFLLGMANYFAILLIPAVIFAIRERRSGRIGEWALAAVIAVDLAMFAMAGTFWSN